MEFHRHWKVQLYGPGFLLLGVLCLFSPQLLAMVGYEFRFGDWIGYVAAAISLLAGAVLTIDNLKAHALRIDGDGLTWTKGKQTTVFRWEDVARVAIENKPSDGKGTAPATLTVWTAETVSYPVQPDVTLDGLRGYHVADVGDLAEPATAVDSALLQYAGHRFARRPDQAGSDQAGSGHAG